MGLANPSENESYASLAGEEWLLANCKFVGQAFGVIENREESLPAKDVVQILL